MPFRFRRSLCLVVGFSLAPCAVGADEALLASFRREARPILEKYCHDCHGAGVEKGGVTLDEFDDVMALRDHKLWERVLRNVRTKVMPPADEAQPSAEERDTLMRWIKRDGFGLDPARPDPGRVTVRRLNRVEYRNTIRDLTGVDFDTQKEFPADDTGHGFDTIGDVLTISPMLLEKYLDAAQAIVGKFVPLEARVVAETSVAGRVFKTERVDTTVSETLAAVVAQAATPERTGITGRRAETPPPMRRPEPRIEGETLGLSYYTPALVSAVHKVATPGKYQVVLDAQTAERYVDDKFDLNKCRVTFRAGGEVLLEREFVREGGRKFEFVFERELSAGELPLTIEVEPLEPAAIQHRNLRLRVNAVHLRGPLTREHWVKPKGYEKVFPRDPPEETAARRAYARELLERFATRAFRRPVEPAMLERLVALAESTYSRPRTSFETGIAQAFVAVLASPSFLFREERTLPRAPGEAHPLVDEYALASRLSYFLWSTMPDQELFQLARQGRLRAELPRQIDRMLADKRSGEFVRNFTGQWLQARDVQNVVITASDVYLRDHPNPAYEEARATFRRLQGRRGADRTPEEAEAINKARAIFAEFNRTPKPDLTGDLRRAMREETEMTFAHLVREDRSLVELLDSDYTFLNEDLAKHYGIEGVSGKQMRKVTLPAGSPRGGVLTQGTVLAVTSNPTRTSPVKRGVFILEAILGSPPAPPPPDIPSLEEVASPAEIKKMSLRESLALHAKEPLCASCHMRMDPLGLALENFNALGMWRTAEMGQPIAPEGKLITGETFADIRELKRVLATAKRSDFYHCVSEKLLTYALGRGLDYYDTTTLDELVAGLEAGGGKPSVLLRGIINSAAFQRRRLTSAEPAIETEKAPHPVPTVISPNDPTP